MTETKRDRGRPKGDSSSKGNNLIIRVDNDMLIELDKIVEVERQATGYNISRSDIVRKAITDFIQSKH